MTAQNGPFVTQAIKKRTEGRDASGGDAAPRVNSLLRYPRGATTKDERFASVADRGNHPAAPFEWCE